MNHLKTLPAVFLVLLVASGLTKARRFVKKKENSTELCIMIDIDMNIEIQALKEGKVVNTRNLTPDDKGIKVKGECEKDNRNVGIFFSANSMWAISFSAQEAYPVAMYNLVDFVPKEIFGGAVNVTKSKTFIDPNPKHLTHSNHSYKCDKENVVHYVPQTNPSQNFSFNVIVDIMFIQAQGFGLVEDKYGPSEVCADPMMSTTAKPVTHSQTTKAPHTTVRPIPFTTAVPGPEPPVNTYEVKSKNITCIAMKAAITLDIQYAVKGSKHLKKAEVFIPASATYSGNCNASAQTQTLSINFFKSWSINITFSKDQRQPLKSAVQARGFRNSPYLYKSSASYRISAINLTVVVDEKIFPGSVRPPGSNYTVIRSSAEFPKVSTDHDYFQCDSETVDVLSDKVQMKTKFLRFKAFNKDSSPVFDGKAAVCVADKRSPKSHTGLIIGLIIVAMVVAAVVTVVVMRLARRNRMRYENIQ